MKKIVKNTDSNKDNICFGASNDSDYFYFFCPACPDEEILRILDFSSKDEGVESTYNDDFKRKAKCGFIITFKLYCEKCGHTRESKISNTGLQDGQFSKNN